MYIFWHRKKTSILGCDVSTESLNPAINYKLQNTSLEITKLEYSPLMKNSLLWKFNKTFEEENY